MIDGSPVEENDAVQGRENGREDGSAVREAPPADGQEELREAQDRLLRLAAEFDNYRKRTTREKTESFDRGAAALIGKLLEVFDDIGRLSVADPATTSYEAYREAFDLLQKKLYKQLQGAGLKVIDPVGLPFDPTEHDAISVTPADDPAKANHVSATFQTGYEFRDILLRPARVQVFSEPGES